MPERTEQISAALAALRGIVGDDLLGVCLHGSAVSGGLRPHSDIDLLAVVARDLTEDQRNTLLSTFLRLSGRHPARPGEPRCLEVVVFRRSDLGQSRPSMRAEFVYGEWSRDAFEAGRKPMPECDPEYALLVAQARREAVSLFGPPANELLPEIAPKHIRQAIGDALQTVLDGLYGDERNALLTLARMWRTASTMEFVAKDVAAAWAILRLPAEDAETLAYARRACLSEVVEDWSNRHDAVERLAAHLRDQVADAL